MEFLSYDDDDDASENSGEREGAQDVKEDAPETEGTDTNFVSVPVIPSQWIEDSDDSDENDEEKNNSEDVKTSSTQNPLNMITTASAASLLASDHTPNFLTKEDPESFQVPKMVNHSYSLVNNEKKYDEPTTSAAPKNKLTSVRPIKPSATSVAEGSTAKVSANKGANSRDLGRNNKQAADKETAKDRVKRQRLSGQSGIGSDFKEWRSEEFMKQRQQYD